MSELITYIWFDHSEASTAVSFYATGFPDTKIDLVSLMGSVALNSQD